MTDDLASWNDGPAKQSIVDFVTATVTPGPDFVDVADRIATFDNDGTLWVERPLPPQFDFVFRRWAADVAKDPSLADQQPYKALAADDHQFFAGLATQDPEVVGALLSAFGRTWLGTTPDEFDAEVRKWLATATQPTLGRPYLELIYQPMRELLAYLRANGFRVFVCSGGGRDFMRVFLSGASDEVPDKQGRVTIPAHLRQYAGLTKDCTVIGQGSRIEVWDTDAWTTWLAEHEQAYSDTSEEVVPGLI